LKILTVVSIREKGDLNTQLGRERKLRGGGGFELCEFENLT